MPISVWQTTPFALPLVAASYIGEVYTSWGELATATMVGVAPSLLFAFFGQRYLLAGLAPRGRG